MVYLLNDDESVWGALQRLLRCGGSSRESIRVSGGIFAQRESWPMKAHHPGHSHAGVEPQGKPASKAIRIPVIAFPAFDEAGTCERARELGATASFRKPVDGQALAETIHWAAGPRLNKKKA